MFLNVGGALRLRKIFDPEAEFREGYRGFCLANAHPVFIFSHLLEPKTIARSLRQTAGRAGIINKASLEGRAGTYNGRTPLSHDNAFSEMGIQRPI